MRKVFVTGTAGFIGYHLAKSLIANGFHVHGYDGMTDYYDVALKEQRHQMLLQSPHFTMTEGLLEDQEMLDTVVNDFSPEVIVHLAGQAGVRYSSENPRAYLDSNVVGTFNVMEVSRRLKVKHLLMASTSSVYGANEEMPYAEVHKADTQMSFYASTKKATESMAHSYAHLYNLPITMFRFFTVYGPWGRPDMAHSKFADAILAGRPIDIYNNGDMYRDFTYVDDLVCGIRLLVDCVPVRPDNGIVAKGDSLSPVAPYRVVNIGNSEKVKLLDFIEALEASLGREAIRNYLPIQMGDVPATWADTSLLRTLTGHQPKVNFKEGVDLFVDWFTGYYSK